MQTVRTFPVRLPPLPGEALDSWLEALAERLDTPLGEVLWYLGFPTRGRAGNHRRDIPPDWTIMLREHETAAVAHACGLSPHDVTGMTLAHYDQRALLIDPERRHVNRRRLWGRASGSRFCPDCLAACDGRWQLAWRLGWTFACTRHHRLLADCCPHCGRIPRTRPRSGRSIPSPGICGNQPVQPGAPCSAGCGFDLARTRTLQLPPEHPALTAQEQVTQLISSGRAKFGAYAGSPQHVLKALADIRALGGRAVADLPQATARKLVPEDLLDEHCTPSHGSHLTMRAADRPGFMAPPRAASTAFAVTLAHHVLDQPDAHQAGNMMRVLLEAMEEEIFQISATSIDSWGRGLSPVLNAVHLSALAPSFRPSQQLLYRTAAALPKRPNTTSKAVTARSRKVPSILWTAWTVRLIPTAGTYPRLLAPALASSLLAVGNRITLDAAAKRLGSATEGHDVSRHLQLLDDHPSWPDIVSALIRLADYLDGHKVPIDYQRRRRLDYTNLLPHGHWQDICQRTGASLGNGRREQVVRSRLFQRISGLPAEAAPSYSSVDEAAFRAEVSRFTLIQTPELAEALADEAARFLAEQHIRDEPVTWQPPLSLLEGLQLPEPDPRHIDISHLHRLVRQHNNTLQTAAGALGTSIEAVRHVLDEHPAPELPPTKQKAKATGYVRRKARQDVPKETFVRLYQDEHRSLYQIAEITGYSRQMMATLAREYGIPLRKGKDYKRRSTVERGWLHEQYVIQQRTLPDLAREKGMSTANMARWAHVHKIPLRPRGGASHNTSLRAREESACAPALLLGALKSPTGRQRLERFAAALSYPTLRKAAQALGTTQTVLAAQVKRLERDLGQPLLERAERGRPMKPTPFGNRVADAVNKLP